MTAEDVHARKREVPRADRVYLGWQHALLYPDPGPPPRRPTPPEQERLDPTWVDAERSAEHRLNRPITAAGGVAAALALLLVLLAWPAHVISGLIASLLAAVSAVVAVIAGYAAWQGERAVASRVAEERRRIEHRRAVRERELYAAQEEHARQYEAWQARRTVYDGQPEWYAVSVPREVGRVDVVWGTPRGWVALVTTAARARMDAGARVTIVDLTGGAVARGLTGFGDEAQRRSRIRVLNGPGPAFDALLQGLRPCREPWERALFVCGAERLTGDGLDLLYGACARTGTGLVALYGSVPRHVAERLGPEGAAVVLMRPEGEEAAAAAAGSPAPPPHAATYRLRFGEHELHVDARELRGLPTSTFLLSHAARPGARLVRADANPSLRVLRRATLRGLEEARLEAVVPVPSPRDPEPRPTPAPAPTPIPEPNGGSAPGSGAASQPPNVGAPPRRLDWRERP